MHVVQLRLADSVFLPIVVDETLRRKWRDRAFRQTEDILQANFKRRAVDCVGNNFNKSLVQAETHANGAASKYESTRVVVF